jgi:pyruvate dehydrogenase E2 component (dihydrolipoamide acetyltransferase)
LDTGKGGQIMKMTIKMPRVGETVDEVYLVAWNKAVGDVIAVGDDLMEVETDKATVQVPSPVAGTLLEIFFKDGDEIKTGDAIAVCESN